MRAGLTYGRVEPESERRFSLRDAAQILEVPEARLRALARAGFLATQRGPIGPLSFGFQDLLLLRTTKGLLESGVPMRRIRRIWASLREQLASDLPLTSIAIRTDGEEVVASDGTTRWRPDTGQFLFDFEASEIAERAAGSGFPRPAEVGAPLPLDLATAHQDLLRLDPRTPDRRETRERRGTPDRRGAADRRETAERRAAPDDAFDAEQWYETGCELEGSAPALAREAYARAIALDPALAVAHVNLGRLEHLAGERGRAEPHYREAVRLDPDDPTPHFNLGVLLEELDRGDEAVHAYRQAILRDPDFANAHCNLGLLLESVGRRQEAMRHLMAARKLEGSSEAP